MKHKLLSQGFTLVELLIVMALLAALAMGLLATINPFEQVKRGQDTQVRDMMAEFVNANTRYYANNSSFPWGTSAFGGTLSGINGVVGTLVTANELKPGFQNVPNSVMDKIYLTSGGSDMTACFQPQSDQQQHDKNTKYTIVGAAGTNCMGTGGTAKCYWCAM